MSMYRRQSLVREILGETGPRHERCPGDFTDPEIRLGRVTEAQARERDLTVRTGASLSLLDSRAVHKGERLHSSWWRTFGAGCSWCDLRRASRGVLLGACYVAIPW